MYFFCEYVQKKINYAELSMLSQARPDSFSIWAMFQGSSNSK